ncbi:hypothetical protein [Chelativorans sp. Marseille-P2723]|uniref:hypothetical protein n=1 Tax=Chelativorans sp. Marseille-P2723 TaxID=2709133 RepID=UPI0015710D78|nr:hypothetical protein [Chelativorans sp. Marseille-P2723]
MRAPTWRFEWNLNTIVLLFGLLAGVAAWGATWERMSSGQAANLGAIDRLDRRVTSLETTARMLDNHELRISNVEKQASDAATAMRAVEAALNALAADMKVTREILQRIEAAQNGRRPQ